MAIRVVDASDKHTGYISLCTHLDEEDQDHMRAAEMRERWLRLRSEKHGMKTKVALEADGRPQGFIHMVPIGSPISGMMGEDIMVIPCLTLNYQLVYGGVHGTGVGSALVEACEEEAKKMGFKGLAVYAYTGDFWFMPSAFFERVGFKRASEGSDIWVKRWADVEDPKEPEVRYKFQPIPGKVVIDYFWSPLCFTVCKEVLNVRQAASEFSNGVELREYRTDEPGSLVEFGMLRALFIDGQRKFWGYEAPKEELRREIKKALKEKGCQPEA